MSKDISRPTAASFAKRRSSISHPPSGPPTENPAEVLSGANPPSRPPSRTAISSDSTSNMPRMRSLGAPVRRRTSVSEAHPNSQVVQAQPNHQVQSSQRSREDKTSYSKPPTAMGSRYGNVNVPRSRSVTPTFRQQQRGAKKPILIAPSVDLLVPMASCVKIMIHQRAFVELDGMAMNARTAFTAAGDSMKHLRLRVGIGAEPEAHLDSWRKLGSENGWKVPKDVWIDVHDGAMGSDTDSVLREMSGDQFQATNTFVLSHGPSGTDGGSIIAQMLLTSLSDLISVGVQAVMLSVIGVRSNGTIYDAIAGHDVVPPQTAGSLADFLGTLSGMVLGDTMINKAFHVWCSIREQIPTDNMTDVITLVHSYHGSLDNLIDACAHNLLDLDEFAEKYELSYESGTYLVARMIRNDLLESSFIADGGLWGSHSWITSSNSAKWLELVHLLDPTALSETYYGIDEFRKVATEIVGARLVWPYLLDNPSIYLILMIHPKPDVTHIRESVNALGNWFSCFATNRVESRQQYNLQLLPERLKALVRQLDVAKTAPFGWKMRALDITQMHDISAHQGEVEDEGHFHPDSIVATSTPVSASSVQQRHQISP